MPDPDYDDPEVEASWCAEKRARVEQYLQEQKAEHGRVGDEPAWHIAPCVSIWAVESPKAPGSVGFWAICGDLPTDYVSSEGIKTPREAMRAFAKNWKEQASLMKRGDSLPGLRIGPQEDWPMLGDLLDRRADLLAEWAEDDSMWQD